MNLLSKEAEQQIIDKVVDAVFKALEVSTESNYHNKRYLRPNQAAVYADISVGTLRSWVFEKGLPQAKIGQVILYDMKELDEFIAKYRV